MLIDETDCLSDGKIVLRSTNGPSLLRNITGSGCMVGYFVATFCAAASISATQGEAGPVARLVDGNILITAFGGHGQFHIQRHCAGLFMIYYNILSHNCLGNRRCAT